MSRTNSYVPVVPADLYRPPISRQSQLQQAASVPVAGVFDTPDERYPTFLGVLTGIYLTSVVILSTALWAVSWVPQVIGVILGIAWLVVGVFIKGQDIRWTWPITLFSAYVVWQLTGLFVTAEPVYFVSLYTTQIKVTVVTWICFQCVRSRRDVLLCYLLLGFAAIFVLFQGIDSIVHSIEFAGRKGAKGVREGTTLLTNANSLGEFGVVAMVGVTACFMGYKSLIVKCVSIGVSVAALYIIAASGSRTAMLGFVTFAGSLYWFHFRKAGGSNMGRRIIVVFLSLFVLGGSVYFVAKLPFFYRLQEVFSSKENLKEEPRVQYFFLAMKTTAENPVFGLGVGGFALARLGRGTGGKGHYSHSTVSETLSCTGIPGFCLYFGSQFMLFRLLQKTRKLPLPKPDLTMVNIVMGQFWVIMLFSMVANYDSHRLAWPLMGALLGYVWNLNKKYEALVPRLATV